MAGGISSIGAVGPGADLAAAGADAQSQLFNLIAQASRMNTLLENAEQIRPAGTLVGYACNVDRLTGPGFALLGNAAEFLDPVFSSGVTIALKSAILAGRALDRRLQGETVDWMADFETPLKVGVNAFRAYVEGWYDGSLQEIIFAQPKRDTDVKRKIISVLAVTRGIRRTPSCATRDAISPWSGNWVWRVDRRCGTRRMKRAVYIHEFAVACALGGDAQTVRRNLLSAEPPVIRGQAC